MNTEYGSTGGFRGYDSPAFFGWGGPLSRMGQYERELRNQYGNKHDDRKPPSPEPGDKYIVIGMVFGLILGGALGAFGGFGGIAGGVIGGGIIGAVIGDLIRKRRLKNKNRRP